MSVIYHLARESDWERALANGAYVADSLDEEGFIHCSTAVQHAETANRLFAGAQDLRLLLIDTEVLGARLKVEIGFPHIYGALDLYLGRRTRPHADLEITVRWIDQKAVFERFAEWDLRKIVAYGELAPWNGEQLEPLHQVWGRRGRLDVTRWQDFVARDMLDLLFEPSDADSWVCRRDESFSLPLGHPWLEALR